MPNQHTEQQDKRSGHDRRRETRSLRGGVERRHLPERRQTSVSEISYFEWALQYVKFHGRPLAAPPSCPEKAPDADDLA